MTANCRKYTKIKKRYTTEEKHLFQTLCAFYKLKNHFCVKLLTEKTISFMPSAMTHGQCLKNSHVLFLKLHFSFMTNLA